jgi:exonuclease SbcD
MLTILHFADAHIDMANYGRHDAASGLPLRVLDFLKSLDAIIDTAIEERVDLVIFAGDAYKDRTPAPTYQREWGRRIMRLSRAGIPALLLIGNHDVSPAQGRAHTVQEYETLEVPHVHVLARPAFLGPDQLEGLPLQVLALPWVARSGLAASLGLDAEDPAEIYAQLEARLKELVDGWLAKADPSLPVVLTAHGSVQGAVYGGERTVMLGGDLVFSGGLVKDPRLDYVALGHIHKAQNLNLGAHPPVIYPGSIERVDFGEAQDDKFFVVAHVEKGRTEVSWRKLSGIRPFIDRTVVIDSDKDVTSRLLDALPLPIEMEGAVIRLTIDYPRQWDALIDEMTLRQAAETAFEFHLVRRPQIEARGRLVVDEAVATLGPLELLDKYWKLNNTGQDEQDSLQKLAQQLIQGPPL